jgi:hypothetical protein
MTGRRCFPNPPCSKRERANEASLWGSQSWLQPAFSRLSSPRVTPVSAARDIHPLLLVGGLLTAAACVLSAQSPSPDPVLRAMHDEIERAKGLAIPNLEAPYFIQYVLDQEESFNVSATLGGLMERRHERFRQPDIRVRVGSYKFDNGNFAGGGGGTRYDLERFPIENEYPILRRYFWLETDGAYKGAVEAISRKRAALRNMTQSEPARRLCAGPASPQRARIGQAFHRRRRLGEPCARAFRHLQQLSRRKNLRRRSRIERRRNLRCEFRRHRGQRSRDSHHPCAWPRRRRPPMA